MTLWKLNTPIPIEEVSDALPKYLENIPNPAKKMSMEYSIQDYFESIPPEGCIHILVQTQFCRGKGI